MQQLTFLFFISLFFSTYCAQDQDAAFDLEEDAIIYNNGFEIKKSFSINNDFHFQDWYFGFSGGIEDVSYQWGAKLSVAIRPFRKKVQILQDNNVIRQYHERKYFISLDLDKRLGHFKMMDQHFQLYFGAKSGVLLGNYAGTRNDAINHWIVAPMAGICLNIDDNTFIKLGYIHIKDHLLNVIDGRINFSIQFAF